MSLRETIRFGCAAVAVSCIGLAALTPIFLGGDRTVSGWAATGFLAMAAPGIVGGLWLAREHGRSGTGFVVALGAGFVARLILAATSVYLATKVGSAAAGSLVAGLAAGFVPVVAFEMFWFSRARVAAAARVETRR